MNYNFASIKGLGPGSLPYLRNIPKARRAETFLCNEQNLSRKRVSEQNFEQNKRFLRALQAGRISHFTSRIYPSLLPGCPHAFFAPVCFLDPLFRLYWSLEQATQPTLGAIKDRVGLTTG